MKLTEFVLKNRVTAITIILLAILGGIRSYLTMPKAEDPGFTIRNAIVVTYFPGASPQRVEELVTDKIEEAVKGIPEIKEVTSTSKNGFSMVMVEVYNKYSDMQPIWDNLRRKVQGLSLPTNTYGPFVNDEFGDVYGTIIGVTGKDYSYKELKSVADDIKDELLTVTDVAKVNISGVQEERIFIEYKNDKLAEIGITPYQLQAILAATNIVIPGGNLYLDRDILSLEPTGNFESLDELGMTVITAPNSNQSFYLKDIADIKRGYIDPAASEFRVNDKAGLAISVSMKDGGNIVALGKAIDEKLGKIKGNVPVGIDVEKLYFQPKVVDNKIKEFSASLIQAIVVVVIVLLVFLGFRTGIIIAFMIPIIVAITFLIMSVFHIKIEQISLAALIIALGMLVDNSIVVAENIMVKMERGKKPESAAIEATNELKLPLFISSLVTCTAFLPIALGKTSMAEFCLSLFQVISITLLTSWLLSLTLIPLLCVWFIKVEKKEEFYNSSIYKIYKNILLTVLKNKYISISILISGLFLGVFLLTKVPFVFMPNADKPVMTATIKFPGGTSIKKTEQTMKEIDAFITKELKVEDNPEKIGILDLLIDGGSKNKYEKEGILNWGTFIGESAPRFYLSFTPELSSPEYSFMLINVTSSKVIPEISRKLEKFCLEKYPEMDLSLNKLEMGPPSGKPIQIKIKGKDIDKLYAINEQVKQKIKEIKGTRNITDDWGLKSKKVIVNINQSKARKAGLTSQDVAGSLYTMIDGYTASNFRENSDITPIVLRSKEARSNNFNDIKNAKVFSANTGTSVNLSQVADIQMAWEPSVIYRTNQFRTFTVSSDLSSGYNALNIINSELIPWLNEQQKIWGNGYSYEIGGSFEVSNESVNGLVSMLPVAGMIILLLLTFQFNSYRKVGVLVSIMPFIIIPVGLVLALTGREFGFMPMLGLIALAGISINIGIVLMDKINSEMLEGKDLHEAVIDSCLSRMRPVFLTTTTAFLGLLPLWLTGGPLFSTMAIVMMAGLAFIIFLVLIVLPLIFTLYYRVNFKK